MKKTITIAIILAFVTNVSVTNADYTFGTPTNLGPTVNSSYADPNPSISADGLELYFESYRSGGYGSGDLYVSTRNTTQDPWGVPVNLGPTINTSRYDGTPCISADGLTLYFGNEGDGIMVARRAASSDGWGPPTPAALSSTFNLVGTDGVFTSLSSDGLHLYFSEHSLPRPGGFGGADLWVSERSSASDMWSQPRNLGSTVNSSAHDRYPSISADGLSLFFGSYRSGGYGHQDIWVATRAGEDEDWGTPVNLGPMVNTSANDGGPSISVDGRTLYFYSNRPGGYGSHDIWQVPIDPIVDLNADGIVDAQDMCIVVDNWGTDNSLCDIGPMPWGDGVVDVQDLIVLSEHLFEGIGENVIERRISRGSDDAEEALNSGFNNWNYSSDLEIVHDRIDNGGEQLVGMTFRDIAIMPGEVISNAYIEFVCDEIINGTADAYLLIWGHFTPNSEGFVAPYIITNRPKTQAMVPWQPEPWNAGGQKIQSVNIAPIIQELIDQPGWAAGNAVEIIIGADPDKPTFTGVRCAESYDGSPSSAPLLHIEIAAP